MNKKTVNTNLSLLEQRIWEKLQEVKDPEIPTLSVVELGIIAKVGIDNESCVRINMTPTFTGCPAIEILKGQIRAKVISVEGVNDAEVVIDHQKQWNTNDISPEGRKKLKEFGIAPPEEFTGEMDPSMTSISECPYCNSKNTVMESPFGPTLCRSIHYCKNCRQSYEQFKPIG